jgi:hypothetical protein
MPEKKNKGIRKNSEINHHNSNGGRSGAHKEKISRGECGGCGRGRGGSGSLISRMLQTAGERNKWIFYSHDLVLNR